MSNGTLDLIDKSRRARLDSLPEARALRRQTLWSLRADKEDYVRSICERVEHHLWSSDSRPAYRGIKALGSSKPVSRVCSVKASSGELLTDESKVKARWAEYFKQLYQADPPATPLEISTMPLEAARLSTVILQH